jgi:hypothetical protein
MTAVLHAPLFLMHFQTKVGKLEKMTPADGTAPADGMRSMFDSPRHRSAVHMDTLQRSMVCVLMRPSAAIFSGVACFRAAKCNKYEVEEICSVDYLPPSPRHGACEHAAKSAAPDVLVSYVHCNMVKRQKHVSPFTLSLTTCSLQ